MITDPNRKGDINEYKATVWLLEQGYEVYKNVGCTGEVDLVAIKDGEISRIDVKSVQVTNRGMVFRTTKHEEILDKGIRLLWVLGDTVGWNRDYF